MLDAAFDAYLRFISYVARADAHLDVAEGALLIANVAYPALYVPRYLHHVDALAQAVREELGPHVAAALAPAGLEQRATAQRVLKALADVLGGREGFHAIDPDGLDPRGLYLNVVLERRVGTPLALGIVYLAVARRLGVPLVGAGLPAHFVIKWPLAAAEGGDIFLDALLGARLLDAATYERLYVRMVGDGSAHFYFDPRWARSLDARAILTRALSYLKTVYLQRGETALALEVVDRLILLRPDRPEEMRDRGLLRLAMGEPLLAAADIAAYAERAPGAPDVQRLRRRLGTSAEVRAKLN